MTQIDSFKRYGYTGQTRYETGGNKDLAKVLREQVYLSDIPNYLMNEERASTEGGLSAEQDRLQEKMLSDLGLSVKRKGG